jgi:hypothetical protein
MLAPAPTNHQHLHLETFPLLCSIIIKLAQPIALSALKARHIPA